MRNVSAIQVIIVMGLFFLMFTDFFKLKKKMFKFFQTFIEKKKSPRK